MRPTRPERRRHRGFTLIEAIMVIVITGIISAIVSVFIKSGVDTYFNTVRRAEMTDIADTALRRMGRDLRLAVPNTARVTTSVSGATTTVYLEILLSKAGGRYDATAGNCFTSGCASITTQGSVVETIAGQVVVPGGASGSRYGIANIVAGTDLIVIYNQYNNSSPPCVASSPSAYCGDNTSLISAVTDSGGTDTITFANKTFVPTNGSPTRRFQVIDTPVTYACSYIAGSPSGGTLIRYSGYTIVGTQPTPPVGGVSNLLATNVSNCNFTYTQGVFERWGVVGLLLELTESNETVSLYHEAHLNNTP
jgi:MSHA biogenesis protein MshO